MTPVNPSAVAADPTDDECPGCEATVQECAACGLDFACTAVNPRLFLDHLTATVELAVARSVLREIITLADESVLTDEQLRVRLLALAGRAR